MPRKLIILILTLLALSLAFSQGYNMQVVAVSYTHLTLPTKA